MTITPDELETCLRVLQSVARDTSVMDEHDRFKALIAKIHKQGRRGRQRANRQVITAQDKWLLQQSDLIRTQQSQTQLLEASETVARMLTRSQHCYVCKQPFVELHFHYHLLCPVCAAKNWEKRQQRADLSQRVALVTGGRIKIGFEVALKLLRDGARVLVTTRFPDDAVLRFKRECDFLDWSARLEVHGLDLRDLPAVETFADNLSRTEQWLDIVIHNAAQTIKRPLAFYRHLLDAMAERPDSVASNSPLATAHSLVAMTKPSMFLLEGRPDYRGNIPGVDAYFPPARFDEHGQQMDLRPEHSWRMRLGDVGTIEFLEVMLVNATAPFVLTSRLLPALERSPHERRFIVNVSAMEGQFSRETKTPDHPHTNMAKAALNMLTRTSAGDLARRGIFMNSVDTGWITDEKPAPAAKQVREREGFFTPLDIIDGAARIYDPIASGLGPAEPLFGHFLKDYQPYAW